MRIGIFNDEDQIASLAADRILEVYRAKPNFVLGLATGSSPLKLYAELVRRYEAGQISFAQVRSYNLDEYVGLPRDHYEGYANFIHRNLVDLVDMPEGAAHGPDGWCDDLDAGAAAYDEAIKADGGIDIQVLGIGSDGHIGFNEPGSSLASGTRVKTLAERTRIDNARFFNDDVNQVPMHCITQGIGTILKARHLVLLAFGAGKAEAIAETVEGGVSAFCPASALQLHPHATIIVDEAAASRLRHKGYYKYAFAHKPSWQGI